MRNAVLTGDDGSILKTGGDVMAEIAVDSWDYVYVVGNAGDGSEEVDGGLKTTHEESGTGQEEVSYGCGLEVKR